MLSLTCPLHFITYPFTALPTNALLYLPIHFLTYTYSFRCILRLPKMPTIPHAVYSVCCISGSFRTIRRHNIHTIRRIYLKHTQGTTTYSAKRQILCSQKYPYAVNFEFRLFLTMFAETNLINPQRYRQQDLRQTQRQWSRKVLRLNQQTQ